MMSMNPRSGRRRAGMTLIEILVVIAIIAVLVSLLMVGVMAVLGKGTTAQNRFDIQQLDVAVNKFKTDFLVYPPNEILLCASSADYAAAANPILARQSLFVLTKIWPNLIDKATGGFANLHWAGYDSNTMAPIPVPKAGITLEGDQCLVFFLGGIPLVDRAVNPHRVVGMLGFSTIGSNAGATDPTHLPDAKAKGGDRKKFFEFNMSRLYFRNNQQPGNTACQIPSYNDAYSVAESRFQDVAVPKVKAPAVQGNHVSARPFVYFSSTQLSGGVNSYDYQTMITFGPDIVAPYQQSTSKQYANADTFQIISAGADGLFGFCAPPPPTKAPPGSQPWSPGNYVGHGADDMSNFWPNTLNVP